MMLAKVKVICPCGRKHQLIPGIDAPVYWCGEELLKLKEGDDVEIEDMSEVEERRIYEAS